MKKTKGKVFAAAVLSVLLMVSLATAAPQDLQPSSGQSGYVLYPDIYVSDKDGVPGYPSPISVEIRRDVWAPNFGAPMPGDPLEITCIIFFYGCTEKQTYSNRIDIDGKRYYEGTVNVFGSNLKPNCNPGNGTAKTFVSERRWIATPGSHTITCIVDSKNDIEEGPQNELNNTKSIMINIAPQQIQPQNPGIKEYKTKEPIPVPVPGVK